MHAASSYCLKSGKLFGFFGICGYFRVQWAFCVSGTEPDFVEAGLPLFESPITLAIPSRVLLFCW